MNFVNAVRKYGSKIALGGSVVLASMGSAMAALPTAVGTTVTAIQTDASDIFDLVFPVVGIVIGLVVVIKLFKKFTNKI